MIVVVGSFLAGMVWRRTSNPSPTALRRADRWVINIALPALIVSQMVSIDWDERVFFPIAAAWWAMGLSVAAIVVCARLFAWPRQLTGALLLVAVLGNTSFLGLGVVEAMWGETFLPSAVAYDQPGTFLALATWGSFVASAHDTGPDSDNQGVARMRLTMMMRKLVTFAPFLALLMSIPLRLIPVPEVLIDGARLVGRTVAPVALCAVGARFTTSWSRRLAPQVMVGLGLKMIAAPALVLLLALWWDADSVAAQVAVTQASAPPMVTAGIVAIAAGYDEDLVTALVGWGTLCGFAWMPLVAALMSKLF